MTTKGSITSFMPWRWEWGTMAAVERRDGNSRPGVPFVSNNVKVKITKLWAVEKLKNQSGKSMRARFRKRFRRTTHHLEAIASGRWYSFQNIPSGSLLLKSDFPAQNLIFFNGFPISEKSEKIFFNDFPISSMAFRFPRNLLQWLSDFFNGFPLSSTPLC